ncbi:hypothetical protein DL765_009857 [Monosporascus sp. GIB2]|nr:hypothetical protein DL765_009857 [Monosporascus sp. GIB2]
MSANASTGSPGPRRTPGAKSTRMEENIKVGKEDSSQANVSDILTSLLRFQLDSDGAPSLKKSATALSTASLVNQSCPKRMKLNHETSGPPTVSEKGPVDSLLAKLSKQQAVLHKQGDAINNPEDGTMYPRTVGQASSSNSVPITPATEAFGGSVPATRPASAQMDDSNGDEVLRLKLELAQAQNKISHLSHELIQREQPRPVFHPTPPCASLDGDAQAGSQSSLNRDGGANWPVYDDSRSDTSDALSATGFNRSRNIWVGTKSAQSTFTQGGLPTPELPQIPPWPTRGSTQGYVDTSVPYNPPNSDGYRGDRLTPDYDLTIRPPGGRRSGRFDSRFASQGPGSHPGFGSAYTCGPVHFEASHGMASPPPGSMSGAGVYSSFQPSPIGTPLSPLASEFTSTSAGAPWKTEVNLSVPSNPLGHVKLIQVFRQHIASEGQTYLPTTEPLNYRRLLDRNVNCNWKYIVDKIVCNNDQQASIFLQQKLKVGTSDQKYEIVEAIVAQAYSLMVNRFGNFLVQRCFEHGTPEQVIKIAEAIRGKTLSLSMDPFGCHVVQKAFDSVPEDYKALMVHELLRRIPETVIHRYACHVWQKLFELRWTESPPQIMKYVNEALRGMWHEVALGETGSLVVQNIFENCLEEDKRPCIEEVLTNIDIVAHGQFGNWCIQHICEHGAPADRSRAIDHVIRYAAEYSMDQYASKVVKKCLKIGGPEFLNRYLDRVCEGRMDRPRIPLIDIASDQYGNYLIQWILTHAGNQHKDIVAAHIRKHMVSLRGSKFGSRVGMLCTNPAVATRPGPGVSSGFGRMPAGPRYGGRGYQ